MWWDGWVRVRVGARRRPPLLSLNCACVYCTRESLYMRDEISHAVKVTRGDRDERSSSCFWQPVIIFCARSLCLVQPAHAHLIFPSSSSDICILISFSHIHPHKNIAFKRQKLNISILMQNNLFARKNMELFGGRRKKFFTTAQIMKIYAATKWMEF